MNPRIQSKRSYQKKKKNFSLDGESPASDDEIVYSEVINQESAQTIPTETETEVEEAFNINSLDSDSSFQIPFENSEEEKVDEEGLGLEIPSEEPVAEDIQEEQSLSATELFEQRQRQYLIGKKVTKTIHTTTGQIIINSGDVITEELINEVKLNGKLIELVMNYEE